MSKAAASSEVATRLRSLARIASLVNAGNALPETLERITLAVCQRTRWSSSALMALDELQGLSLLVARHDPAFPTGPGGESWDLASSPSRQVLASGRSLVIERAREATQFPTFQAEALARDYETVVLLPLSAVDAEGRGMVMAVHAHRAVAVDAGELAFLETVAHLASLAVDRALRLRLEREQSEQLRAALAIQAGALDELLAGADLPALAALGARHLEHPFLLVDLTADRLLAGGRPAAVMPRNWSRTLAGPPGAALAAWLRGLPAEDPGAEGLAAPRALPAALLGLADEATLEAAAGACLVEGACLGGLLVFTEGRPLTSFERLIASQLRFALAVSLMRAEARIAARAESLEDFFSRLFAGTWGDQGEALARARRLGLDLQQPARLALLELPPGQRDGPARAETLRLLRRQLARQTGAAVVGDEAGLLLLLPEPAMAPPAKGEAAARATLERLAGAVAGLAGQPPAIAFGRPCASLADYGAARADCRQLLALARRGGRRGILGIADFGPFARFLAAADGEALRRLLDETLGRIEAVDRGGTLVATLAAFLEEQGRYRATADRLGLHVTTLRYRLRRLRERFDVDLDAPDTRLALALALRARGLLGGAVPVAKRRGKGSKPPA